MEVLIRWRTYIEALVWDIKKAYHQIYTTDQEKYLRLLTWRDCDINSEWKIYGYTCVGFGDVPASVLLELTKEIAAAEGEKIDVPG